MKFKSTLEFKVLGIIIFLLFFNRTFVFSQTDTLLREISTYQDTTIQLINNARSLMLKKFNEHDFKVCSNIKKFLQKAEGKEYLSLYPIERWLLDYNLVEYDDIMQTVLQFDSSYYASLDYRVKPQNDVLEIKLINYSNENISKLKNSIDNTSLVNEEKEFLKLNLIYILVYARQQFNYIDTLNDKANLFIETYPESKYIIYIKKYIRNQTSPSDAGFGFNAGFGVRMNSGAIRNTIDEGILFDFGLVFTHKKWDYNLYFLVGPVQLQKDLPVKGKTWTKGSEANYFNGEFSVARNLLDSKRHRLLPSIGVGLTQFSPYQDSIKKNSYYKDIKVNIGNLVWGINYQYKYPIKSHNPYSPFQKNYGCINLRYALSWQITNENIYKGFINYITLTWQFEMHGIKRE